MDLLAQIKQKKAALVKAWLELTLKTYPPDSVPFFRGNPNEFSNPVGNTISSNLTALVDDLVSDAVAEQTCSHLDPIVKVRTVQDFTPGQALSFVFSLRDAVREVVGDVEADTANWRELNTRIDQLALFGFDIYTKYRQRMYEIRIEEIKLKVASVMKRSGMFFDGEVEDPAPSQTDHSDENRS